MVKKASGEQAGHATAKLQAGATHADYLRLLDPQRRKIASALMELVNEAAPRAEAVIKWGYPWWVCNGYVCYLAGVKDRINFGFARGAELDDPNGLLEGTGKGMRHIKVGDVSEIKKTKFVALVRQAVRLNTLNPLERF